VDRFQVEVAVQLAVDLADDRQSALKRQGSNAFGKD